MKKWKHTIELIVDRLIPYLVILLAVVIIIELFFEEFAEANYTLLNIVDYVIIAFFAVDLYFKYIRIRNIKSFFRTCWLDILAIFPFVLIFRVVEEVLLYFRISREVRQIQSGLHLATGIEKEAPAILKEGAKIIQEVERTGKISRTRLFLRVLKPLQRSPRLLKAVPFYEKPTGKHHIHELEELPKLKKEIKKDIKKLDRKLKNKLK